MSRISMIATEKLLTLLINQLTLVLSTLEKAVMSSGEFLDIDIYSHTSISDQVQVQLSCFEK